MIGISDLFGFDENHGLVLHDPLISQAKWMRHGAANSQPAST
jgi:hypothetical protein